MSKLITSEKATSKTIWTVLDIFLFLISGTLIIYMLNVSIKQPQSTILYITFGIIMLSCVLQVLHRTKSKSN